MGLKHVSQTLDVLQNTDSLKQEVEEARLLLDENSKYDDDL